MGREFKIKFFAPYKAGSSAPSISVLRKSIFSTIISSNFLVGILYDCPPPPSY